MEYYRAKVTKVLPVKKEWLEFATINTLNVLLLEEGDGELEIMPVLLQISLEVNPLGFTPK